MSAPAQDPNGRSRNFLAVALDLPTRSTIAAHLEAHGGSRWPGRLVAPRNWHLTLRFLGWTNELQRDVVLRSLDEADLPSPFRIRFGGAGAFPKPRRATVTWIGVVAGEEGLSALAAACNNAAAAAAFANEDRPYHPHVTLSRVRPPEDVTKLVEGFPDVGLAMDVTAVTMYRSDLRRGGAEYEPIETVAL